MNDVLAQLSATLEQRKLADPASSYVAGLHASGLNKILEKVGEEATEVILAAKDAQQGDPGNELVGEVADLWFHCMVMLSHLEVDTSAVMRCLAERLGTSGLDEKAARDTPKPGQT